ncbi:MAG: MFS transporter, partial [Dongiaceae bacterium]
MPPSTLRWLPWFLVPVIALETIVIDLILPALPDMARDFALNPATAQTVISLFLLSYAISQPVSGPLADRFGRRRVLILSMAGVTLAHLGAFLANEFWIVQVCRFLLGLAGGACLAVGLAVFRDLYAEERLTKMFGYVFALAGVLSIVSGLGGGWLAEHGGWHSNMLALTAISAVYVVLLAVLLPETRPENMAPSSFRQWFAEFKVLAGQTHFWTACLANGHNYAVMLIFVSAIPFVLADQYQFQGQQIGNFFALVIGSYTVGSVMAGAFSRFSLKHRSLLGAAHSILPFILTVLFLGQSVQPWSLPILAAGLFFSIACV